MYIMDYPYWEHPHWTDCNCDIRVDYDRYKEVRNVCHRSNVLTIAAIPTFAEYDSVLLEERRTRQVQTVYSLDTFVLLNASAWHCLGTGAWHWESTGGWWISYTVPS